MNYNKLIKFYKGYVLLEIHSELNTKGIFSIDEVDQLLKTHAETDKSCKEMDYDELLELITWSFDFGNSIGLNLNFKNNEWNESI
jgi:hypothetical protein